MEVTGDDIAETVQSQFDRLPQKRKPQARGDALREWVPLSGIIAQGGTPVIDYLYKR
jgi:tRNA-specific adenosine deaminase 1